MPAWSPDGQRIAFIRSAVMATHRVRQPSLYVASAAQRHLSALTAGAAPNDGGHVDAAVEPSWSPDGSKLVFTHVLEASRYGPPQIALEIANADGSNLHVLGGGAPTQWSDADWSRANGKVAFVQTTLGGVASDSEIYTVNPDGSDLTRLTTDSVEDAMPAWSPDGSKVAFVRGGLLSVMNADGSEERQLSSQPALDPSWSPDGSRVAFDSDVAGNVDVYTIAADGSALTRVTDDPAVDSEPSWSPSGRALVFASGRGVGKGSFRLWLDDGSGHERALLPERVFAANGARCTIIGTAAADALVGTHRKDVLCGRGGKDQMLGRGGNDILDGGPGKDRLDAGPGNDVIFARDGARDDVLGGRGFDRAKVDLHLDRVHSVESEVR
jgi:Tol biopolymer transport system component